jgi:hypothetical protein
MIHDCINNTAGDRSPSLAIRIGKAVERMAARIRIGRRRFDRSKRKDDTPESWHGNCKKITSMGGSSAPTQKRRRTAYEQVQYGLVAILWGSRTELTIFQLKYRALQSQARSV